uniref:Uncharacterized protein n=1 Tax=Anguilla anguilla TaxID=7936 RepID=A0A0E9XB70_ANGAN
MFLPSQTIHGPIRGEALEPHCRTGSSTVLFELHQVSVWSSLLYSCFNI